MNQAQAQWNLDAARAVVHGLVSDGLHSAVISPGSRNTPLTIAFSEHPDVELRMMVDERSAAFFALGKARASASPVALVCTSGSAGAHYLPAVIEADASGLPLILLTADRPWERQDTGSPQTMEQRNLFGRFVRTARDIPAPGAPIEASDYHGVARRLLMSSMGLRPGPVHLNMAFREPLWHRDVGARKPLQKPNRSFAVARPSLGEVDRRELMNDLAHAQRGVIVCGPMSGMSSEFGPTAIAMAEALGWPLIAEAGSGVRFGGGSTTRINFHDGILRTEEGQALVPGCILRFGQACLSKALSSWIQKSAQTASLITVGRGLVCDPELGSTFMVNADPESVAQAITHWAIDHNADDEWLKRWQTADDEAAKALNSLAWTPDWEGGIAQTCLDALPDGATLHVANSMPIRDINSFGRTDDRKIKVWTSRGINGIDGTLSTAAGEASAHENTPFGLLMGDLAFIHDMSGLLAIAQSSITVVVVDNRGGGIFEFLPISENTEVFERCFATPQDVDLAALCAATGVAYLEITDPEDLKGILRGEFERDGACVIRVPVDRQHNKQMHAQAWRAIAEGLEDNP